jgi:FkbH-like protein
MPETIESFSLEEKRSLLASLLKRNSVPLQLSITQERLWQLCQMQSDTPLYNFQISLELEGKLFAEALKTAALRVALRHEALWTGYGTEKGMPALTRMPPREVPVTLYDLSGLPEEIQERSLEARGREDARHSFRLDQPPLLRLTLVRLAPEKHRLFLTMHHIVSDFLSLDLFLAELGEFYSATLTGKPAALPPLKASYQDFARAQRSAAARAEENTRLEYWRQALDGAEPMEWFSDHTRPAAPTGKAGSELFRLPAGLMREVEAFARKQDATPFMVLLAGFNLLLHACSGQQEVLVGSPLSGRTRREYQSLVGMFSYPVLLRTSLADCGDFQTLLRRVRKVVLMAAEHGDVPFAKVCDSIHASAASRGALLRAMFSYVGRLRTMYFEGLQCRRHQTNRGITDLDLFMTVYPDAGEWHGVLEYNLDLFETETVRSLVSAYAEILQTAVANPGLPVAQFAARVPIKPPAYLSIAATFTADPLLETLQFWARELDLPFRAAIAPYNQMLQQLIDPGSCLFSSRNALNVLLVRVGDWLRDASPDSEKQGVLLQQSAREFIAALWSALPRMSCSVKIYLCPASSHAGGGAASIIAQAEQSIREAFAGARGVEVLNAEEHLQRYSVAEVHDSVMEHAAHIPYKPMFYAALGSSMVRQFRSQFCRPRKVLVLDCDNTLWQGLCAEEGPHGVLITEEHRALQHFALLQAASGVLLCLNSKNAPEHVWAVFRENSAMILKETDISAYRINWEAKSSNLESLAAELGLGLDSFVFVDDDPRECAEAAERCPQVLAIRLPETLAEIPCFLQHLWSFDRESITEEDRRRTTFYHDNQRRELALWQAPSLAEFLAGLELLVDVKPAGEGQMERIAQLSQRTNQFNASGLVFSVSELLRVREQQGEILGVDVSDRFGEYGLAGALICRRKDDSLAVEAFYLSCRVLGRGVEHRIISELGRTTQSMGLRDLCLHYRESTRNQPFRHFLNQLSGRLVPAACGVSMFTMTAGEALCAKAVLQENEPARVLKPASIAHNPVQTTRGDLALARIPHDLSTAQQLLSRMDAVNAGRRKSRVTSVFKAPECELEHTIAEQWREVLRLDKVGRTDNFFELGGNSLLLVQLNGNLISRLNLEISIPQMFQYPTVASLAAHLAGRSAAQQPQQANIRGAQSRTLLRKRQQQLADGRLRLPASRIELSQERESQ